MLGRDESQLTDPKSGTSVKWGEYFNQFDLKKGFFVRHYNAWFLIRRFVVVNSLIFLSNGFLQLVLSVLTSLIEIVFIHRVAPYSRKVDNCINLLNEVSLVGVYSLFGYAHLSQTLSDSHFEEWDIGLVAIIAVGVINFINITVLLVFQIRDCRERRKVK